MNRVLRWGAQALLLAYVLMFFALMGSLLMGCAPEPVQCRSFCGMELLETPAPQDGVHPWTCAEFQALESATLAVFEAEGSDPRYQVQDPRFRNSCSALRGYQVRVLPYVSWMQAISRRSVNGETSCGFKEMVVNNVAPMLSSLTHEMAHAVQDCKPWGTEDQNPDDAMHRNWGHFRGESGSRVWDPEQGIYNATWAVIDIGNNRYGSQGSGSGYGQ